jgi:hypothetical protein
MREGQTLLNKRSVGEGRQQIWMFKTRKTAVAKFVALVEAQLQENAKVRQEYIDTLAKARQGDMAAVLAMGDF